MKSFSLIILLFSISYLSGQDKKISTIDFVQILNNNQEETIFYYENNWLVLRKMAIDKNYIDGYELMKVDSTEDAPFHLILKTTYANRDEYDKAEERFQELIKERGPLKLLNEKSPGDFRKVIFSKSDVEHLSQSY